MSKRIKLKDVFILLIKYMPIVQMVGMLFNNLLFYFDICNQLCYVSDFILGNSLITTFLLFVCGYMFGFCNWHRLLITSNFVNITIASIDSVYTIPINDLELIMLYVIVYLIFLFIIIYKRFCK